MHELISHINLDMPPRTSEGWMGEAWKICRNMQKCVKFGGNQRVPHSSRDGIFWPQNSHRLLHVTCANAQSYSLYTLCLLVTLRLRLNSNEFISVTSPKSWFMWAGGNGFCGWSKGLTSGRGFFANGNMPLLVCVFLRRSSLPLLEIA